MNRTNWSRCSSLAIVALLVFTAVVMPVGAVSVKDHSTPQDVEVGSKVTATVTLTELYKNPQLEQWTLAGGTDLQDVTWTVTYYDQTGAKVNQQSFDGGNFSGATISAKDGTSEVQVRVTGTVPEMTDYTYSPPQSLTLVRLEQTRKGGTANQIDSWSAHYYTADSKRAREAIDGAQAAVQGASGGKAKEAKQSLSNAKDAYANQNFDLATKLANEAQTKAKKAKKSSQTTKLALYAVGGLVVVGLIAGGFLWYRSQQDSYDKLG